MGAGKTKRYRKSYRLSKAAVRKRIAAFFYSTQFCITYDNKTKYEKTIKDLGAAQLQRLRLFFVVKGHYIAFYPSRAPPSDLEIHKKF